MVIVSKGKTIKIQADPIEDSPSKKLVETVRGELHELNKPEEEKKKKTDEEI